MLPPCSISRSRSRGLADGGRGAFSLIEVVIALAILVALAALVLPALLERTRDRAAIEAVEITRAACSRASSESQRGGFPVLLAAVVEPEHVRLVGSRVQGDDDETGVMHEIFSIDLPTGMSITTPALQSDELPARAPLAGGADQGDAGRRTPPATTGAAGDTTGGGSRVGARTTLTLAFPDGRCAGGVFDLVTPASRRTRFMLSEWTSTVRVESIAPTPSATGTKPDKGSSSASSLSPETTRTDDKNSKEGGW